jgi:hypothetical protein
LSPSTATFATAWNTKGGCGGCEWICSVLTLCLFARCLARRVARAHRSWCPCGPSLGVFGGWRLISSWWSLDPLYQSYLYIVMVSNFDTGKNKQLLGM